MLTVGLRWVPEIALMKRIIARNIRPGVVTAAVRLIAALTTPKPASTNADKNVPRISENSRRYSKTGSSKLLWLNSNAASGYGPEALSDHELLPDC